MKALSTEAESTKARLAELEGAMARSTTKAEARQAQQIAALRLEFAREREEFRAALRAEALQAATEAGAGLSASARPWVPPVNKQGVTSSMPSAPPAAPVAPPAEAQPVIEFGDWSVAPVAEAAPAPAKAPVSSKAPAKAAGKVPAAKVPSNAATQEKKAPPALDGPVPLASRGFLQAGYAPPVPLSSLRAGDVLRGVVKGADGGRAWLMLGDDRRVLASHAQVRLARGSAPPLVGSWHIVRVREMRRDGEPVLELG